jgi:hypothetical protein
MEPYTGRGEGIPAPDAEVELVRQPEKRGGYAVYINREAIGGDTVGGRDLMRSFLYTLTEIAPPPEAIILVGPAVRLAMAGSAALESLSLMHEQGVEILAAEQSIKEIEGAGGITVGRVATMHVILNVLLRAEKVLTL